MIAMASLPERRTIKHLIHPAIWASGVWLPLEKSPNSCELASGGRRAIVRVFVDAGAERLAHKRPSRQVKCKYLHDAVYAAKFCGTSAYEKIRTWIHSSLLRLIFLSKQRLEKSASLRRLASTNTNASLRSAFLAMSTLRSYTLKISAASA